MRASYLFGDVATIASLAIQSFSLTTYFLRKKSSGKICKNSKVIKKICRWSEKREHETYFSNYPNITRNQLPENNFEFYERHTSTENMKTFSEFFPYQILRKKYI